MFFRGMLIEIPGHRGIGKLKSAADGRCTVSVFRSILRTETAEMPIDNLRRAYLSPQTRVYVRDGERFKVGRVKNYFTKANGLIEYEIRFPNNQQSDVSELDLYVRPWNAPEDPAEILANGGAESQFLHDRRQSAVERLLSLRAAAQGLTSLISAGVEFVPHQIAAVRRVLTDPIQRYLLADEVGLGKTIEAGLIIRQHLIDNPSSLSDTGFGGGRRGRDVAAARLPGRSAFSDRGVIARVDVRVMSFLRSAWVVTGCSGGGEGEHPLHVPRHGHEVPLAAHPVQPAERKLAEPERRFDDAEHRLRSVFALGVELPAFRRPEPMRHGFDRRRIVRRGRRFLEAFGERRMMRLTAHRD